MKSKILNLLSFVYLFIVDYYYFNKGDLGSVAILTGAFTFGYVTAAIVSEEQIKKELKKRRII